MAKSVAILFYILLLAGRVSADSEEAAAPAPGQCPYEAPTALVQKDLHLHNSMAKTEVAKQPTVATTYINLDLPPEERFKEFAIEHRDLLVPMFKGHSEKMNERLKDLRLANYINTQKLDEEEEREIRGFLKYLNTDELEFHHFRAAQFLYEEGAIMGCSGILAAQKDGTVIHARNMDLPGKIGLNMTGEFIFTKGGKPLFEMVGTYGDMGMATGLRYKDENGDGWSFEQNTRRIDGSEDESFYLAANTMGSGFGGSPYGFRARKIMEETPDFKTAVKKLVNAKFSAPSYFVVAGSKPWQGAVITMGRAQNPKEKNNQDIINLSMDNVEVLSKELGRWFVAQYNYDNGKTPHDGRRRAGNELMMALTQDNVNEESMMRVMKTEGVSHADTHFTWVGTPAKDTHYFSPHDDQQDALYEIFFPKHQ